MTYTTVDLKRLAQGDPLWSENGLLGLLTFVDGKPHCLSGRRDDQGQFITFPLDGVEAYGTPPEERPDRCRMGVPARVVHNAVRNIMKNELNVTPESVKQDLVNEARSKLNSVVDEVVRNARLSYTDSAVRDLVLGLIKKEIETIVTRLALEIKSEAKAKLSVDLTNAIESIMVDVFSGPLKIKLGSQTVKVDVREMSSVQDQH